MATTGFRSKLQLSILPFWRYFIDTPNLIRYTHNGKLIDAGFAFPRYRGPMNDIALYAQDAAEWLKPDEFSHGRGKPPLDHDFKAQDPYYKALYDGLERLNWRVEPFAYWTALCWRCEIIHIHGGFFPVRSRSTLIAVARIAIAVVLITWMRARGSLLVWSVHNLANHEQFHPQLEARYMRWLTHRVALSIHMSEFGRTAALKHYPTLAEKRSVVIPLMHFGETFRNLPTPLESCKKLGLGPDHKMILMLGMLRPYKNIPVLMQAFSQITDDSLRLFIVGRPLDVNLVGEIKRLAKLDQRVVLSLQVASVDEVKTFMAAASLVVAPYREILNSGSALLGLTHHRPVLLPDRGAMAELQSAVGPRWIKLYDPPLTPKLLFAALDWAAMPRPAPPNLSKFDPDRVVHAHHEVLLTLIG